MTLPPIKVHISGTSTHIEEDMDYLQTLFRTTYETGALVVRDWLTVAKNQYDKYTDEQIDWRTINEENIEALSRADIFIIDVSRNHLYTGYQVFIASHLKKPTLVVTRGETAGHFVSGIEDKYVKLKTYTSIDELESIIKEFIKANTIPAQDLRFNFFLDRRMYKYLRDKSYETGKNKSEIVRELLEKEIKRRDS
jgi:hypothetical protein